MWIQRELIWEKDDAAVCWCGRFTEAFQKGESKNNLLLVSLSPIMSDKKAGAADGFSQFNPPFNSKPLDGATAFTIQQRHKEDGSV